MDIRYPTLSVLSCEDQRQYTNEKKITARRASKKCFYMYFGDTILRIISIEIKQA